MFTESQFETATLTDAGCPEFWRARLKAGRCEPTGSYPFERVCLSGRLVFALDRSFCDSDAWAKCLSR